MNNSSVVSAGVSPAVFNNPEFGSVRAIMGEDGEPLFYGKDVAICLGYKDPAKAVSVKVDDEDKRIANMATPGGKQDVTFISESGLYSLIISS